MPITIVSALPKTAQAPASDTTGSAENSGSGGDFASLLLGQLFQATPGASSVTAAPGSFDSESASNEESSDGIAPSDPLALLAALSQAPAEQRGDVSNAFQQSAGDLAPGGKINLSTAAPATDNPATAAQALGNAATADSASIEAPLSSSLSEAQTRESGQKAAKFAVTTPATFGENVASARLKTAELQTTGTNEAQSSASGVQASIHAARQESAPPSVPTPLHDRNWSNDFGQKVVWLATSHKQSAELTLTPPQMGSIEISLKIDNGTASATATFVSTNAEVRETIEAALPRLREMLAGVGIELGQANVSAESFRQQTSGQGNEGNGAGNASRLTNDTAILAPELTTGAQASERGMIGQGNSLVDIFA